MSWIEKHPGVCGSEACIRKTRHTVHGLVVWKKMGISDERILEHHPDLTVEDLKAAWEYYGNHVSEIDSAIESDNEA
jgi:uncharacterized protein (DUF433 family)